MPTQIVRRKACDMDHAAYPDSSKHLLGCPRVAI